MPYGPRNTGAGTTPGLCARALPNSSASRSGESGGELGIRRNGTHAQFPGNRSQKKSARCREICHSARAGAIGVPFITAYEGTARGRLGAARGRGSGIGRQWQSWPGCDSTGTAWAGARKIFGVVRALGSGPRRYKRFHNHVVRRRGLRQPDPGSDGTAMAPISSTNTVGSPYFEQACRAMAVGGRQNFHCNDRAQCAVRYFRIFNRGPPSVHWRGYVENR